MPAKNNGNMYSRENGNGKGDAPRNISPTFKKNYDKINWGLKVNPAWEKASHVCLFSSMAGKEMVNALNSLGKVTVKSNGSRIYKY